MRALLIGVLLLLLVCCACLVAAIVVPSIWEAALSSQERELAALHETLVDLFGETEAGGSWDNVCLMQEDGTRRWYLDHEALRYRSANHLLFTDLCRAHDAARIVCLAATGNAVDDLQSTHTEISARMAPKAYPDSEIADFLRIVEITRALPECEVELLERFLAGNVEELGDDD